MRILLTNNHLVQLGGTETWVLTMARYLSKEHEVGVFTHHKGYVSNLLAEFIDDNPTGYDLALINHNTCIDVGAKRKIYTSHGTVPELEKPMPGCDVYVAVNENTAQYHAIDTIIKNPIDTELFTPTSEIREKPERILNITNCKLPFPTIQPSRHSYTMPDFINSVDVVVSMGRGALEAMACGRAVITWDAKAGWQPRGDGYLNPPITGFTAGEYANTTLDWQYELSKYKQEHGARNRQYILDHHDVKHIAKEYLSL